MLSCPVDHIRSKPACFARNLSMTSALIILVLICVSSIQARQAASGSTSANQSTEKSLADVAREAKQHKTASGKKAITEDDIALKHGPLPSLNVQGDDNWDEVVGAIGDYQAKHTASETEKAVRDWYDEYDALLASAIKENLKTNERRTDSSYNGYLSCETSTSYEECAGRRRAEMHGAHDDQVTMHDNAMVIGRIQQSFMKIRAAIAAKYHLQYSWFKVRNGNGNGSF